MLDLIMACDPFCFVRFNDGEMMGIEKVGAAAARGDQIVNRSLHDKLIECIQYKNEKYIVGGPCSVCFPKYNTLFNVYRNMDCLATTITNKDWRPFIKFLPGAAGTREVTYVCGADQDTTVLRNDIHLNVVNVIKVPMSNAWKEYQKTKDKLFNLKNMDIIMFSCGPMSRVLAKELFEHDNNLTCLDVGSTFDPFTRNVWHRCHLGTLPHCKECNNVPSSI